MDPAKELAQGKNIVDAAKAAGRFWLCMIGFSCT